MRHDEYRECDALDLARLVRSREVTPDELLDVALKALEAHNPQMNAVVHRMEDRARKRIGEGLPEGPFRGVPFLLKDQLDLEGTPMTLGSALLKGYLCNRTHPLAERIESSGLVLFGRTNMSELGMVPTTEPRHHGATRNPWNHDHSPGGSSGGSGAAVAAGIVPMAHAVDGGGSIRIPAAACGLVGLKPSRGRNPTAPYDDPDGFVVHHCVSHTVRDSAALLDATQGARRGRWQLPGPEMPYLEAIERSPGPLRVGFTSKGFWGEAIDPEAAQAVERTARLLAELGHEVEEVDAPFDAQTFAPAFRVLWASATGVFFKLVRANLHETPLPAAAQRVLQRRLVFRLAAALPVVGVEPFTRRLADLDHATSASDLWLAGMAMQEAAFALEEWFQSRDLWLTPLLTRPPVKLGGLDLSGTDEEVEERLFAYVGFTPIANTSGVPAIAVPAGRSAAGLPLSVHLVAPLGRDDRLLQVARQLEVARPWPRVWSAGPAAS